MNTLELQQLLKSNPVTKHHVDRVCALDQLPEKIQHRPKLYIVNSQESGRPGKHWLALYFPKWGPAEFFDSLGHGPRYYHRRLERFLKKRGGYYIRNRRRYQQAGTRTCGAFCYYYVHQRCEGRPMKEILRDFDEKNLNNNETLVTEFMVYQDLMNEMDSLTLN